MINKIFPLNKFSFFVIIFSSIIFLSCEGGKKNNDEKKSDVEKINEAIINENFIEAYGVVDEIKEDYTNSGIKGNLNKKIMMAEIGSVLEENTESKNKAAKIILIINERGKYNNTKQSISYSTQYKYEDEAVMDMYKTVISIAEAQGDNELKEMLNKALTSFKED